MAPPQFKNYSSEGKHVPSHAASSWLISVKPELLSVNKIRLTSFAYFRPFSCSGTRGGFWEGCWGGERSQELRCMSYLKLFYFRSLPFNGSSYPKTLAMNRKYWILDNRPVFDVHVEDTALVFHASDVASLVQLQEDMSSHVNTSGRYILF